MHHNYLGIGSGRYRCGDCHHYVKDHANGAGCLIEGCGCGYEPPDARSGKENE